MLINMTLNVELAVDEVNLSVLKYVQNVLYKKIAG